MEDAHRIAFFIPSLSGGGAERVFVLLSRALSEQEGPVDLLLAQSQGPYLDDVAAGVRLVSFNTRGTLAAVPALIQYLRAERPSVLCSALPTAHIAASLAVHACRFWENGTHNPRSDESREARRRATRHIVTIHELPSRRRKESTTIREQGVAWALGIASRHADHVVAVSQAVAADVRRELGVRPDRLQTIYNPIEVEAIRSSHPPVPHPWLAADAPPTIVSAGRFVRQKNMHALVHALAYTQTPCRLILLGDGPDRVRVQEIARELGVADRVACPGFVRNPYDYITHADVFALASRWEAFGNVVVEALAAGTPVVCTDAEGGMTEILRDPREPEPIGTIVPVGDAQAFAAGLDQALTEPTDPDICRRRAMDFTISASASRYAALFRGDALPTVASSPMDASDVASDTSPSSRMSSRTPSPSA